MANEKVIEKIDKALWRLLERYVKDEPWKAETVFVLSYQIKKLFKALGYHKIRGEPPILSDEEIETIQIKAGRSKLSDILLGGEWIAETQRDADVEFYKRQE